MSSDHHDARSGVVAVLQQSRALGFLGPTSLDEQIEHALAFITACDRTPRHVLDLGSGGGLPGLVLAALAWPDTSWCLLDGGTRRAAFLRQAITELAMAHRVTVDDRRAEDAGRDPAVRGGFDLVVARSFGKPAVVAECAAPFLEVGGYLVVSEPPQEDVDVEERWPQDALTALGLLRRSYVPGPPAFVVLEQVSSCPDHSPRRVGIPAKRPLF